ncbi:hypothetical protein HMSSN036_13980 [Paenibacillus macerans]|nr:hypothetical protein HMSSN036_13980 [Paenibacillus macerans]
MIGLKVIGISLLAAALFLYELPLLRAGKKKEKIAFAVLTLGGWGLGPCVVVRPRFARSHRTDQLRVPPHLDVIDSRGIEVRTVWKRKRFRIYNLPL